MISVLNKVRRSWGGRAAAVAVAATLIVSGCAKSAPSSNSQQKSGGGTTGNRTLTVAYGSDFVFLTSDLGKKWWQGVADEFQAKYPNVKVKFTPIAGGYNDITNKLSLLYRTPSTAPDVAEVPAGEMGPFESAGYLRQIDNYLPSASWWTDFPQNVKAETEFNGHYYGVNHGENTTGFWYNTQIFKQAGIPVPWQPKTWDDVLATAQKIHSAVPSAYPLWLSGGTAGGTIGIQYNAGNMLVGSTEPTIQDPKNGKWVVDSPGLRETFQFYKDLGQNGLAAPTAQLLDPNAIVNLPATLKQGKIAIAVGGNWYGESWVKQTCGPCWEQAPQVMAATAIPTIHGQGSGIASMLGGWELSIANTSPNADLAWEFIQVAQQQANMINASNWGGWMPPSASTAAQPGYVNYAPPYQKTFADLLPKSVEQPQSADFQVWGAGFNNATTALIQDPSTSVDKAINIMKTYITNQLGSDKVETLQS
jgi:multiple sugar transport system substrate-binding protein